jgi:D-amino peptidase
MKLLIACDMEGISGVVNWDQVNPSHPEYGRFRKLMTAEVNAAIQGAAAGGATEFLVRDGHELSNNLLLEELDSRAVLITGSTAPLAMVQGVERGIDAAIFIGYHARAGSQNANLDHTWSSARVANVWLNGRLVGEFGLNSAVCGHFGVPVLMVSGDHALCAEAKEWVPEVETAAVKTAIGRFAAECPPPALTHQLIRDGAERAVRRFLAGKGPVPLQLTPPVRIELEMIASQMVDAAALLPGAQRVDGRRLAYEAEDMLQAYAAFRAMVNLAPVK